MRPFQSTLIPIVFLGTLLSFSLRPSPGPAAEVEFRLAPPKAVLADLPLEPEVFDFRYAPRRWQAAICLPDDPHKSIIGSDGALYYDYGGGRFHDFKTRVLGRIDGAGAPEPVEQRLHGPRVPIAITRQRSGDWSLTLEAWAAAPEEKEVSRWQEARHDYLWLKLKNDGPRPEKSRLALRIDTSRPLALDGSGSRLTEALRPDIIFASFWPAPESAGAPRQAGWTSPGSISPQRRWARPPAPCSSSLQHVLVGYRQPLVFQVKAEAGRKYCAVFGLIEGWHDDAGVRPLEIRLEGKPVRAVDLVKEFGKNRPAALPFAASDENGDGVIELGVHSPPGARDDNTILSALWIFDAASAPPEKAILSGEADAQALVKIDCDAVEAMAGIDVRFPERLLNPGEEQQVLVALHLGKSARPRARSTTDAEAERRRAAAYWEGLDLAYDRVQVPDPALQALLDSSIRNIFQARELRNGRPAFQVGPTCYRGLWAADGAFLLEAAAYLGRGEEARAGLELLAEGDEGPQGASFSKKSGLRLWMIWRHAQLTGDWRWIEKMWPKVAAEVDRIKSYRDETRKEPGAANCDLMPRGFGDGGLGGEHREYTNVYWTLSGLLAALEMAEKFGKKDDLAGWRAEYEDYWAAFERARERDKLADSRGNTYVPVTMKGEAPQLPQRGAWAFLQSVFPGRVFGRNDPLMLGTMAMLTATEQEGLIYGTGWIADGIWNYAASFYGHAHLWLGHGQKAASVLYAFANHASPLLTWREEQNVKGQPENYVGDMPHNWASAEFIRLVRHLCILERGRELHLLEGLPRAWTRPGGELRFAPTPTSFGDLALRLQVKEGGGAARLEVDPPGREAPGKVVIHLEAFERPVREIRIDGRALEPDRPSARIDGKFTVELEFQK